MRSDLQTPSRVQGARSSGRGRLDQSLLVITRDGGDGPDPEPGATAGHPVVLADDFSAGVAYCFGKEHAGIEDLATRGELDVATTSRIVSRTA